MKDLYLIGGTMGTGKTTVCQIMKDKLDKSVFLDGDWCWDMHPFLVNSETKQMVMENICFQLNNFLRCSAYENVIFCWVMHEQEIIDDIISRLQRGNYKVHIISLVCSKYALEEHLKKDIRLGIRGSDIIERSVERIPLYSKLKSAKVDVSEMTPEEAADHIISACSIRRCAWAENSELEQEYHDQKWGKPVHDDHELFKMMILEGQQAGLSWSTILKKMDALCEAYDDFRPEKLALYDQKKVNELLSNPGIIRNRLKVNAAINNAEMYYKLCDKYGSLDHFLWSYVGGQPIVNHWETMEEVPANTPLSDEISRQLKKEGFKFVGTTIVYSLMQSVGMVNDHLVSCSFRFPKPKDHERM